MNRAFHNRKRRRSSISANSTPVSNPSVSAKESMEDKIYQIENKIVKMEKELENMKGGLKEMKECLSPSKMKENIIQITDASSVDDDNDASNAHASTSPKPVDGNDIYDCLNDSMHDHTQKDLDVVIAFNDTCSRLYKSNDNYNTDALEGDIDDTMNASITSHNQTNFQVITSNNINENSLSPYQVTSNNMTPNNQDRQKKSKLYNTEGIYIHTILSIGYMEAGPVKCWMYAIGTLSLVCIQVVLLDFMMEDNFLYNVNVGSDFCRRLTPALTTTLIMMAIIFISVVFEDIKESMVEEAILMHAVTHRKEKISSRRAIGLIHICLRMRRFMLPYNLIRCAMLVVSSDKHLEHSSIILDFMSISVIMEADNFMGRFFFSEARNQLADLLVREINTEYVEDKNTMFISISSHLWPRILAIIPTMSVTIGSIILKSKNECEDKLWRFMIFFADGVLPHAMVLTYGFACCIQDKSNDTLLGKYIRFLGDWNLNLIAIGVIYIIATMTTAREAYSDVFFLSRDGSTWFIWLFGLLFRSIYVNEIQNQEITWKHVVYVFVLTSFFIAGYTDLFVEAFLGINLIWLSWKRAA